MDKEPKFKKKIPLTKKQKILKYLKGINLKRLIKRYWITPTVPIIYFIISIFIDFNLNAVSYRIISTFCSVIIGFGINAFYNIIKLNPEAFTRALVEEPQRLLLNLIKKCVFIAFVLLFLSILAVSLTEPFPKIFDFILITAIGYIFNLVFLFFGLYAEAYSYVEDVKLDMINRGYE